MIEITIILRSLTTGKAAAVIHLDGGHKTAEIGIPASVELAITVSSERIQAAENLLSAEAQCGRMRKALEKA